ncbi:MAG TPA: VaFE repeat-containing surface-anchored protein [Clostridiaceae bacterium]|nr:VaFE repeat-containing surface-anchored protein [Clostridiaceae bacterium]
MINTKVKKKNRLLMLVSALIMILGMIPVMSDTEAKAALPEISTGHSKGSYTLSKSGNPRSILQMNLTDEAISDLRQIYGTDVTFLTNGGVYRPQTHDIYMDGKIAFCANPTVFAGTIYTDRVTISTTEVNDKNYRQFFGAYANQRYPVQHLKDKIINYYGNEQTLIDHAAITFLSGIIQQSNVSNSITQELITAWKTEKPGEDLANVITVAELKATTNAFFFSWYYSFDAEITRATGGSVTTFASSEVIKSFLNFYSFVYSKIAAGTIKLLNPTVNIYYTPDTPSTVPVGSNMQVIHAISGSLKIEEEGSIKLTKSSADTILTSGNNCYDLTGTEFTVYEDEALTKVAGKLTVEADGMSNVLDNIKAGTYYAKETKAGKGYFPDLKTYPIEVNPGETAELIVVNQPMDNPVSVLLRKEDINDKTPLALAEFTVKFYGGDYSDNVDPATLGVIPTRTWVLRTDGNGVANFRSGQESFTYDSKTYNYKVSGDNFYFNNLNQPTLPLGTITIQETKAPKDYKVNNEVFVRKIQPDSTLDSVIIYNPPTVPNELIPGKLQVVKASANKDMTDNNSKYSFESIEYGLFKTETDAQARNNIIGTFTLRADGISNIIEDLIPATYYVIETKTSGGYALDNTVHTVNVVGEHLIKVNVMDTIDLAQSAPVDVLIQKVDSETGQAIPQGDASLAGAEFRVNYYKGEHALGTVPTAEPHATWIITTDATGKASMAGARGSNLYKNSKGETVIPLGYITIQEITAPKGYLINNELMSHKIDPAGTGETLTVLQNLTAEQIKFEEEVIKTPFSLRKVITDGEQSEIVDVEVDAVFVAIANKYVLKHGSFEEALKYTAEYAPSEWDRLVTDKNGNATSKPLAYGLYQVAQTEGKDETNLLKETFTFEVKSAEQEIVEYTVNNIPAKYPVRMVKKDAITGENVILNSASFKIKNKATGEYISQKVGSKWYDTFMTTAEQQGEILPGTFYVPTEDDGTTVTPLKVKPGAYIIEEVKTPEGFVVLEEPKELIIGEDYVTHTDQDLDEIIEVVIENEPQYGELTLHKQGELFKEWTQRSVTLPIQAKGKTIGKEVEVPRANETLTLTRVYKKAIVPVAEELKSSEATESTEFTESAIMSEEQTESVEPGTETKPETITETTQATEAEIIEPKSAEPSEKTGEEPLPAGGGFDNSTITEVTEITTDENGQFSEIVEAGTYTVTDKDGNVVAKLVVPEGETATLEFTLTETKMEGVYEEGEVTEQTLTYYQAVYKQGYLAGAEFELRAVKDIKSYDGQTVFYKKDEKLLFAQKDITNNLGEIIYRKGQVIILPKLTAAQMADRNLVDTKVVTGASNAIVLSRIPLGKYTLTEIKAPKGYILDPTVRNFEFTPQEKTVLADLKETPLIDNQRQKLDVSLKKVLLSTPYFEETDFENIVIGMYTAEEILSLAQDSLVAVMSPDKDGKMTAKDIPQGNYYFREISTKDGYILDETEYSVTLEADEDATEDKITILDEPIVNRPATKDIKVVKVDKFTGKSLVGVEFNLFKLMADGSKLPIINFLTEDYIFVTDQNGEILIKGLPHGTYSLEEVKAHDGYISEGGSKAISVADDSKLEIKVENEPTRVSFNKMDSKTGEPVVGATLRLVGQDGNPLYLDENGYITTEDRGTLAEWLTDGTPFIVKSLSGDTEYTIVETEAPAGYHKAEPISFRVIEQKGLQLTEIPNAPYEPEIKTKAFNSDTAGKKVHAISKAKICDVMTYVDLIEDREHKAVAKLVLKSDPAIIIAEAELIFTPQEKDGEVTVCFGEIDLTKLAGERLVIFEKVFDLTTGLEVASHEDINDEDQTITVKQPEIRTSAKSNNKNTVVESKEITIIDTVKFKDLIVGEEYTAKGWLVDKSTGEALLIDGEKVTAETTFVTEATEGIVEVTFIFRGTDLGGKDLVVFEELYYKGELIAEHKAINDKEQTITIEKPAAPAEPAVAAKPITGDDSINPVVYLTSGSLTLLLAVTFVFLFGKKNEQ